MGGSSKADSSAPANCRPGGRSGAGDMAASVYRVYDPVNGGAGKAGLRGLDLGLLVVLQPDAAEQFELRLEEVDVLFLGLEDVLEQLAAHVVADLLAVRDRGLQVRVGDVLEPQVALEDF